MAFVDLKQNKLILKVILAGPPAVGKTERMEQIGAAGTIAEFGSSLTGRTLMSTLPLKTEREGREVEIEVYEWHGPEAADVRAKGLFVGVDGLVYLADARQDRYVDSVAQFEFLVKTAGKSKVQRLPGLLMLGMMDEGVLRLSRFEEKLRGPTWSDRLELAYDDADPFVEALRLFGEVMMARAL